MNNSEAKFILHAYRPNGEDAQDPSMAEALAQVRADPSLQSWFHREQAHSAAVAAKLKVLGPPPELRAAILAGTKASRVPATNRMSSSRVWRMAIAAMLAIGLTAAAWWRFAPIPGETFDEFALNFVTRRFFLQERSPDVAQLKTWLVQRNAPLPATLPAKFANLHALGCRTLEFKGRNVSLVCFEEDGKEFHVFVARRDELPSSLAPAVQGLAEIRDHAVTVWEDAEHYYVLVSDASRAAVERLL